MLDKRALRTDVSVAQGKVKSVTTVHVLGPRPERMLRRPKDVFANGQCVPRAEPSLLQKADFSLNNAKLRRIRALGGEEKCA